MSNQPHTVEICPVCSAEWTASASYHPEPRVKGPHKQCPNGHWTHVAKLYQHRQKLEAPAAPGPAGGSPPSVLRKARTQFGVGNEVKAMRLALIAMLAGHDQLLAVIPTEASAARNLIVGSFGKAPQLARGLLG